MLILGGRYGSIEPESNLSYTELEYQYAMNINKPLFAIVLDESLIDQKIKSHGKTMLEMEHQDKYKKFRGLVLSKICRICKDSNEIKLSIMESIMDIQSQSELSGWIKGTELPDNSSLLKEIENLRKERDELKKKNLSLEKNKKTASKDTLIGNYEYSEIYTLLENKKTNIPSKLTSNDTDVEISLLKLFILSQSNLTKGVSSSSLGNNDWGRFLATNLVPILLNFSLVQREKAKLSGGGDHYRFVISEIGNKFLSLYHLNNL